MNDRAGGDGSAGEGRLKALRMVGFKSFAERTQVEFGPGISCIIGPNGSGKSNLADALRWSLGEQGRSLRTRRAEDLIFAGSSTRRAIGMADVTLLIDNRDRLLPVDYAEIELGRRLFRSGENEYLLNRQKVRLRDLVDLLDEANLADNAFLFIGQGMVDQALALRPEERRPLFEEAAGIRKHERRRRAAEAELAEAEQNLERVRDLLAELRPQARRLAMQAEQQERRQSAASELADALVLAARVRLLETEREIGVHGALRAKARDEADQALADLRAAEETVRRMTVALAERAENERSLRGELESARERSLELRLGQARLATEADGMARERARLDRERTEAETRRAAQLREAALPVPEPDPGQETALHDAERALADATSERDALRAGTLVEAERRAAWLATRRSEDDAHQAASRRASDLEQRVSTAQLRTEEGMATADAARATAAGAIEQLRLAADADERAERALEPAREASAAAQSALSDVIGREAQAASALAGLNARVASLDGMLAALTDREVIRAAQRRGGSLVAEGLDIDPEMRRAVEAGLGEVLRGIVVDREAALSLRERRAVLIVDAIGGPAERGGERAGSRDWEHALAAAAAAGGGALTAFIRRDPGGRVTRLLARTVWVPGLEEALEMAHSLPAGWRVVTRAGELVTDEGVARVGQAPTSLEMEAELRATIAERDAAQRQSEGMASARAAAEAVRASATVALDAARAEAGRTRAERRASEDRERTLARRAETAAREEAWNIASLDRLRDQLAAAQEELERHRVERQSRTADAVSTAEASSDEDSVASDLNRLDRRVVALTAARDERARAREADLRARSSAEERRARAEAAAAFEEQRLRSLDAEAADLHGRAAEVDVRREEIAGRLAVASAQERGITTALSQLLDANRDDRGLLTSAENAAGDARERLRAAETRSRSAEVSEMESRLRFDGAREGLLVELAAIGPLALEALSADVTAVPGSLEELAPALEAVLSTALEAWRIAEPIDAPAVGRLAALRRRYHELGAGNPFAAEEHAEIRDRVETLDAQRDDLETAIRNTRELITNVNALISEQFRRTFAQLETAFARRFAQLFDGGEAQLSLTVPEDLSATGVEITARPPGKKRQPLAMLSGGERTLTAVALLLAMLEVRPVPFCVLDEVDAALDEANIGRFSAALRELAGSIQFVVITHNRGTIEGADALYGVTVDDDAVSRVISMRLADAPAGDDRGGRGGRIGREDLVPVGPAS
jgi:chromosome segregation protein